MPIQVLPTYLVNKIAAGEVIERPASIVKELVENSLDAGATRIDIAVADGGRRLIAVTDNGCGMGPDDLALAFAPHATSKIAREDDLEDIATLGFRGEALASVASVSHAHVRSAVRRDDGSGAPSGYEVEAAGDTLGPARPCAAGAGTTVTVRDLFFNTPARRKFLRTANTELGHISEQLARLALPHPQVAFTLSHNGREIANLPATDSTLQRTRDLFGSELADALLPIVRRTGPVKVAGLVSTPAAARATARWQYFFLNGRYIRDRILSHALREAFRGLADPARSPAAMVFLTLDPREVDVNVHPTKIEVRFRDAQRVYGELLAALRETLNRADLTPAATLGEATSPKVEDDNLDERRLSIRTALADFFRSAAPPQRPLDFPAPSQPRGPQQPQAQEAKDQGRYVSSPSGEPVAVPAPTPQAHPAIGTSAGGQWPAARPAPTAAAPGAALPAPAAMPVQAIQVHNAYIVAPCEDGLVIIDQHALHERIVYNDLRRRLAEGNLTGQRMLLPAALVVTPAEADVLARHEALLTRLGIEVAPFGPDTYAVQRFPALLAGRGVEAAAFVREILDKLSDFGELASTELSVKPSRTEDEGASQEQLLEELLEMLACKAAVKAGQALSGAEMQALLARRAEAEKASACPHGRPTTIKLSLRELEKQFKRS
ncbi:MAG: DNA mismatch repair endonuclease MutL [Phycisphaerae bacterium]|nr:DNA mismatch repair endonuclease MutL [Phycisphaerae bacterium]